jgi:thiamine kinase-like enzyme
MAMKTVSQRPPKVMVDDLAWLNANIVSDHSASATIIAAEAINYDNAGGLSARMAKLRVTYSNGISETYVVKVIRDESEQQSKQLGQPRESLFYESYSPQLRTFGIGIANTVYSYGDMSTGEKTILLEDLSDCIQCGYFYGPGSPLNWNRDLQATMQPALVDMTELELREKITIQAFTAAAKLHSRYWKDVSELSHPWLRGSQWVFGQMEETWQAAQATGVENWGKVQDKIAKNECTVKWDPLVLACCESSFNKISWANYCEEIASNKRSWTLVHGDFHPANMMWKPSTSQLYILDWEMVGVGNGPQEISQYLISHANPAYRREHEDHFIKVYYDALIAGGKLTSDDFSIEQCKQEYVNGGVARWVWFLALLAIICPDPMVQYFHDQVLAFIVDHHINPENIEMPRV